MVKSDLIQSHLGGDTQNNLMLSTYCQEWAAPIQVVGGGLGGGVLIDFQNNAVIWNQGLSGTTKLDHSMNRKKGYLLIKLPRPCGGEEEQAEEAEGHFKKQKQQKSHHRGKL